MKLIVDFDNTLVNTAETAIKLIKNNSNFDNSKLEWDFAPFVNDSERDECLKLFSDPIFYQTLQAYPDAKDVLSHISAKGYKIILCSKRPENGYDLCIKWLKLNSFYDLFDDIVFINTFDKSIIGGKKDVILDDKIECMGGERIKKLLYGDFKYQGTDIKKLIPSKQGLQYYTDSMAIVPTWQDVSRELNFLFF